MSHFDPLVFKTGNIAQRALHVKFGCVSWNRPWIFDYCSKQVALNLKLLIAFAMCCYDILICFASSHTGLRKNLDQTFHTKPRRALKVSNMKNSLNGDLVRVNLINILWRIPYRASQINFRLNVLYLSETMANLVASFQRSILFSEQIENLYSHQRYINWLSTF